MNATNVNIEVFRKEKDNRKPKKVNGNRNKINGCIKGEQDKLWETEDWNPSGSNKQEFDSNWHKYRGNCTTIFERKKEGHYFNVSDKLSNI